ncbi:hypothetical protein [Streptacidiphilus rugosus]|uniref:hypothetical protein n=1 Tax=Streptacidiphilus rugosus TaxID=405783 RepID=UPI00068E2D24|nr:hypothetical protein [Streptacidiphilus rugosus]
MTSEPDVLNLNIICPPPGEGGVEAHPIVNGRHLLTDVLAESPESPGYVPVGPRPLLDPDGPLHATATPHEIRVAVSGCGVELCCGALYVTVRRDGEHVLWEGWRDLAHPEFDAPGLRFAAAAYEAEVLRAEADRGWEWPGAAVARLLEAGLNRREDWLDRWDCEVEGVWASRSEPDRIRVVLGHPRGLTDPDRPWIQFGLTLPISEDDPSDQAARLEAELTAGDPRATAEVWGGTYHADQLGYPWPPVNPWRSEDPEEAPSR